MEEQSYQIVSRLKGGGVGKMMMIALMELEKDAMFQSLNLVRIHLCSTLSRLCPTRYVI